MILEYLGGIETLVHRFPPSKMDTILEYLGGIETGF